MKNILQDFTSRGPHLGYDIRNESLMRCESASPEVGFRPIAVLS